MSALPQIQNHIGFNPITQEQLKPCVLQMIIKIKLTWTWEFIVCLENEKDDSSQRPQLLVQNQDTSKGVGP